MISEVTKTAQKQLTDILTEANVPESHGVGHSLIVFEHMQKALKASDRNLSE